MFVTYLQPNNSSNLSPIFRKYSLKPLLLLEFLWYNRVTLKATQRIMAIFIEKIVDAIVIAIMVAM